MVFFYLVTTGWIFYISYVRIQLINEQMQGFTEGNTHASTLSVLYQSAVLDALTRPSSHTYMDPNAWWYWYSEQTGGEEDYFLAHPRIVSVFVL